MNIQSVAVVSNLDNLRVKAGQVDPFRVGIEQPDSVTMIINSDDAINISSDFTYTVYLSSKIFDCRGLKCFGISIPKIPNVNAGNNTIYTLHADTGAGVVISSTIPVGYYNPTQLCNIIVSVINADWMLVGVVDTVTCSYSAQTRQFTLTSVNGKKFYIASNSSFYIRGSFLANFPSPGSVALDPTVVGDTSWLSGVAAMISTRYITVRSTSLTRHQHISSVISTKQNVDGVFASFNTTQLYDQSDFDLGSAQNTNLFAYIENSHNDLVNVASSDVSTPTEVDVQILDEYEQSYLSLLPSVDFQYSDVGLTLFCNVHV